MSFCRYNLWKTLNKDREDIKTHTHLQMFSRGELRLIDGSDLLFQIGQLELYRHFYLVTDMRRSLILGKDFL